MSKPAGDGCNNCSLGWFNGKFGYGCTLLGCFSTQQGDIPTCHDGAKVTAELFKIPAVEGENFRNCSEILFQDKRCRLSFNPGQSEESVFVWNCEELDPPLLTNLPQPICTRDLQGREKNVAKLAALMAEETHRRDEAKQRERDREPFCLKWESPCYAGENFYFPPQTNLDLSVATISKKPTQDCRKAQPYFKEQGSCTNRIRIGDIPDLDFENTQVYVSSEGWIAGNFESSVPRLVRPAIVQPEENCVRYENDCRMYYVVLGRRADSGELAWFWRFNVKSCPRATFAEKGKKRMNCTSHYTADPGPFWRLNRSEYSTLE